MSKFEEAVNDLFGGGPPYGSRRKLYYAWAEITGKVFVEEDELLEKLSELYPSKVHWNGEEGEWVDESSEEEKRKAFHVLAEQKLTELFPADDPLKVYNIKIDEFEYR